MVKLLLDTHAVLWAAESDARLGGKAAAQLANCHLGDAVISDITLLEIAMLAIKGRIRVALPLSEYLVGIQKHFPILRIEAPIASIALNLELDQGDPFDRVIVATAKYHSLPLVTGDPQIRNSGLVTTIW